MRIVATLSVLLILASIRFVAVEAQQPPSRRVPRLVVLLTLDQMRSDYIESYAHQWTGGLKRLLNGGARFVKAAYPYLNTVTCPGHATIATGTFPRTHGIILNTWWDRERGRNVECMSDPEVQAVRYDATHATSVGLSPRDLQVPTFADELRAQVATPPRIVSVAVKARSAIALAGRRGDVVLWVDRGGLTTSTAYTPSPVALVDGFLKKHPIESELKLDWTRLLPSAAYMNTDNADGERPASGWTNVFPHAIGAVPEPERRAALWAASPLVDEYLARLVEEATRSLELGRRDTTDVLAVSFSSLDSVGHAFGPRSHEVQDALARIDRTVGRLLAMLDERVGRGNYVVAMSSDHGVSPIPEQMAQHGVSAGRMLSTEVVKSINDALTPRFGPGAYVSSVAYTDVYFAPGAYARVQADPGAWRSVEVALTAMPGIARVLRSEEITATAATDDAVLRAARLSYFPGRSGDLVLVPKPYWILSSSAATHGTHYAYDARVPVIFYGAGVRAGRYWDDATPADIAPTLAALSGITMAVAEGRVLSSALAETGRAAVSPAQRVH